MPGGNPPQARLLVDAFLNQIQDAARRDPLSVFISVNIQAFEAGRAMLELAGEQQIDVILESIPRMVGTPFHFDPSTLALKAVPNTLLRKRLPFTHEKLEKLVNLVVATSKGFWELAVSPAGILRAVEDFVGEHGLPGPLRIALENLAAELATRIRIAKYRRLCQRLDALVSGSDGSAPTIELTTEEAWTRFLRSALGGMDSATRGKWNVLLTHCATGTTSKPSQSWLRGAQTMVQEIGCDAFGSIMGDLLAEIGKPGAVPKKQVGGREFDLDPTMVHEQHSDLLRGLLWCTSTVPEDSLAAALGDAADVCFKKIPGIGPRAPKIGNACLWALSSMSSMAAVAQLSRLKTRTKHASTRTQLARALGRAAQRTGLSEADLEEVAVPTCGLTEVGGYQQPLGEFTARLQVGDGLKAELSWLKAGGKSQSSIPAPLRESHVDAIKSLKRMEKEIDKLLPAQRDRLEQLFLQERTWPLAEFRSRFLDHPLVGTLARRLVWRFTSSENSAEGIWQDGRIVGKDDRPLNWLSEETRVALWHPISATVEEVKSWRDWLESHQVRQPFKQAHREIYILTDAERETDVYSNRFAAHVIKQHQFNALCQPRGWRYHLQGNWDSANTPTLALPQWDMRVEFWVEPIQDAGPELEQSAESGAGIYLYLTTDQVRFSRMQEGMPVPLAEVPLGEVPPMVFSEVMRHVDLFVGVASIGNDPNWADPGPLGARYDNYWHDYAFGDLFPSAQTRKSALEQIVPRLKIAERCSFSDKFLIVRGEVRTYKIHLGSGNILMSPNDQYLCIVPKPGVVAKGGKEVYLPFEGDNMLSVILSKALMLADEKKIKDPTILSQIGIRHPMSN